MDAIEFTLNGTPTVVAELPPTMTLLQYLRSERGLTGAKEGCAEGDCGACSVALLAPQGYRVVNACLVLLPSLQGQSVLTVEGLQAGSALHPVQDAMMQSAGSQCGYCTPGFVMALFEAYHRDDLRASWQFDDQLSGNLCRCTGYRPIREALGQVHGRAYDAPNAPDPLPLAETEPASHHLYYHARGQRFVAPPTFEALFEALEAGGRIVAGGTDLGLEITKAFEEPPFLVSLQALTPLAELTWSAAAIHVGAALPLSELESFANAELPILAKMLRYFGSRQIKNRATVGGNLCTASPIGDLAPVLLALGAQINILSRAGARTICIDDFFLDYRKTALAPGELVVSITIPKAFKDVRMSAYKVSKRQELDISAIAAAFFVRLDRAQIVQEARIAYGGMAATPKRAPMVEAALIGASWSAESVARAAESLASDFTPITDHRASQWYRQEVARNLLTGFFAETLDPVANLDAARPTGTLELR